MSEILPIAESFLQIEFADNLLFMAMTFQAEII